MRPRLLPSRSKNKIIKTIIKREGQKRRTPATHPPTFDPPPGVAARIHCHVIDKTNHNLLMFQLDNEDLNSNVDVDNVDEELVGQLVNLGQRDVRLLVNIAMDASVPPLIRPVGIRRDVEGLRGICGKVR